MHIVYGILWSILAIFFIFIGINRFEQADLHATLKNWPGLLWNAAWGVFAFYAVVYEVWPHIEQNFGW